MINIFTSIEKDNNDSTNNNLLLYNKIFSQIGKFKYIPQNTIAEKIETSITAFTGVTAGLLNYWDKFNDEQRKKYSIALAENSDRIINLLNNIINLSTLNSNEYQPNKESINITNLIHGRINEFKQIYSFYKIEFIVRLKANMHIVGDKYYFSLAIDNLISYLINYENIKYINIKLEKIRSKTKSLKNYNLQNIMKLKIKINSSNNSKLFTYFSKLDASTHLNGHELGLALCKKVIELHNGTIKIEEDKSKEEINLIFLLPT